LDAAYLKGRWEASVSTRAALLAWAGVNEDGFGEIVAVEE
jgi:transposase-like protein